MCDPNRQVVAVVTFLRPVDQFTRDFLAVCDLGIEGVYLRYGFEVVGVVDNNPTSQQLKVRGRVQQNIIHWLEDNGCREVDFQWRVPWLDGVKGE